MASVCFGYGVYIRDTDFDVAEFLDELDYPNYFYAEEECLMYIFMEGTIRVSDLDAFTEYLSTLFNPLEVIKFREIKEKLELQNVEMSSEGWYALVI